MIGKEQLNYVLSLIGIREHKHTCGDVSRASSVDPELEVEVEGAGLVARRRLCEYTLPWACAVRASMSAAWRGII